MAKKAPEIRFRGFTEDWEQRKVFEMFKVTRGNVLAVSETSEKQTETMPYPVYSSQTKNDGLMGYYNDFLFENAITWTTDGANAGTVNYRRGKFYSTNVNGVLLSIEGYANKAIAEALNKVAWRYVSRVGNPKLMNNVMSEISIYIPSTNKEQMHIAVILENIDNTIALHQRKLEALQQLKKGLLQKTFPAGQEKVPELRFANFAEDWEQRRFKDFVSINSGRDYKHLEAGDVPVYGTGGYMLSVSDKLSERDSIGIGRKGTIDKPQLLKAPFWTVDTLFFMTPRPGFDLPFLYSMTQKINWKKMDESTGVPSLSKAVIEKVQQKAPKYQEQIKVGEIFITLDKAITLHQRKLEELKSLKKSLLQKMFV